MSPARRINGDQTSGSIHPAPITVNAAAALLPEIDEQTSTLLDFLYGRRQSPEIGRETAGAATSRSLLRRRAMLSPSRDPCRRGSQAGERPSQRVIL